MTMKGGIQDALEQARAAAGDKDVVIGGGADVARQYLRAGLVDEFQLHVVPLFLGQGTRLLRVCRTSPSSRSSAPRCWRSPTGVIHARYRVLKPAA